MVLRIRLSGTASAPPIEGNSKSTLRQALAKFKMKPTLASAGQGLRNAAWKLTGLDDPSVNNEECDYLMQRVELLRSALLDSLVTAARLSGVENNNKLTRLLDEIGICVETFKTYTVVLNAIQSDKLGRRLQRYHKLLDDAYAHYQLNATVHTQTMLEDLVLSSHPMHAVNFSSSLCMSELPPKPTFIYGRDKELDIAIEALLNALSPHIAILGGGGIGKTTFALSLLHDGRIQVKYAGRRFFVSCDGVTTADGIIAAILASARVSIPQGVTPLQALILHLESIQLSTFLVLDNLESAWDTLQRDEVESVLTRICNVEALAVVITMRGTRTPSGQRWHSFPPLEKLNMDDARRLFMDIGGTVDTKLNELLHHLDGLPLAVTLMASLARSMTGCTPSQLLEAYLDENTSLLDMGMNSRSSNLTVSIMVSLNCRTMEVNPDAFELLKLLALLPDGIHDDEIKTAFPSMARCRAAARVLQAVALTTRTDGVSRVLAPIRTFIQDKYPPAEHHLDHLRMYYIRGALQAKESETWIDSPIRQMANAQAILLHAIGSVADAGPLLEAIHALAQFSHDRHVGDCKLLIQTAISTYQTIIKPDVTTLSLLADCQRLLGDVLRSQHLHDEASQALIEARVIYMGLGNRVAVGHCTWSLGEILRMRCEHDEAATVFNEAKEVYAETGDRNGVAQCLWSLGNILRSQCAHQHAVSMFHQAKAAYEELGDRAGIASCLFSMGNILRLDGDYEQAAAMLKEAQALYTDIGDRRGVAQCLWSLGNVLRLQCDYKRAIELLAAGQAEHSALGDRLGIALCIQGLSNILLVQGSYEDAAKLLAEAHVMHASIDDRMGVSQCLWALGDIALFRGDIDRASELLEEARDVCVELGIPAYVADCLRSLSRTRLLQGRYEEAIPLLERAKALYVDIRGNMGVARFFFGVGDILRLQDQHTEAEKFLKEAETAYAISGDHLGVANCLYGLGDIFRRCGDGSQALMLLGKARAVYAALGCRHRVADCLLGMSDVLKFQGDYDQAELLLVDARSLFAEVGASAGVAESVLCFGEIALHRADRERAMTMFLEAKTLYHDLRQKGHVERCEAYLKQIYGGMLEDVTLDTRIIT